jgi:hypothetical protein
MEGILDFEFEHVFIAIAMVHVQLFVFATPVIVDVSYHNDESFAVRWFTLSANTLGLISNALLCSTVLMTPYACHFFVFWLAWFFVAPIVYQHLKTLYMLLGMSLSPHGYKKSPFGWLLMASIVTTGAAFVIWNNTSESIGECIESTGMCYVAISIPMLVACLSVVGAVFIVEFVFALRAADYVVMEITCVNAVQMVLLLAAFAIYDVATDHCVVTLFPAVRIVLATQNFSTLISALLPQWWVSCSPLWDKARRLVRFSRYRSLRSVDDTDVIVPRDPSKNPHARFHLHGDDDGSIDGDDDDDTKTAIQMTTIVSRRSIHVPDVDPIIPSIVEPADVVPDVDGIPSQSIATAVLAPVRALSRTQWQEAIERTIATGSAANRYHFQQMALAPVDRRQFHHAIVLRMLLMQELTRQKHDRWFKLHEQLLYFYFCADHTMSAIQRMQTAVGICDILARESWTQQVYEQIAIKDRPVTTVVRFLHYTTALLSETVMGSLVD